MSSFILSWKNNTNHFSCQKNLISIQFLLIFFHVYFWTGRTSKTTSKFKVPVHSIRIFSHKPRWISKKLFFKPVFSNSLPFLQKYYVPNVEKYLNLQVVWTLIWCKLSENNDLCENFWTSFAYRLNQQKTGQDCASCWFWQLNFLAILQKSFAF